MISQDPSEKQWLPRQEPPHEKITPLDRLFDLQFQDCYVGANGTRVRGYVCTLAALVAALVVVLTAAGGVDLPDSISLSIPLAFAAGRYLRSSKSTQN